MWNFLGAKISLVIEYVFSLIFFLEFLILFSIVIKVIWFCNINNTVNKWDQ